MKPDWIRVLNGEVNGEGPMTLLLDGVVGGRIQAAPTIAWFNSFKTERNVDVLINSIGGLVDEGTSIYNYFKLRGNVNTIVIGYAASIASVIAQGGGVRRMMKGTMMIIHNPQGYMQGEEKDMERQAENLAKCKTNLVNIYHDATGLSKKKISDMMDATTVMTAEEAEEAGFCDEVITEAPAMSNKADFTPKASLASVLRSVASFDKSEGGTEQQQQQKPKIMKSLVAALAAAGLLPSLDMTDEATIVTTLNGNLPKFVNTADKAKITELEGKVTKFEAAHKARISAKVKAAIDTEKLVKEDRKDFLTNMGTADEVALDNYLEDLRAMKGTAPAPKETTRRGAPPVPPDNKNTAEKKDEQILALQNELKECKDGARRVEISRELRELRGHSNLFEQAATK